MGVQSVAASSRSAGRLSSGCQLVDAAQPAVGVRVIGLVCLLTRSDRLEAAAYVGR